MSDLVFDHPRVAAVFDPLDPDRSDLLPYLAMVDEFHASSVLDIGCGTGTFATMLAQKGIEVTGVDPAGASLVVAQRKPDADRVRWVHGTAPDVLPLQVDLAFMTANVAQVFLTDEDWRQTLSAAHTALRTGGRLIFETRDPAKRAWERWTKAASHQVVAIPHEGDVEDWVETTSVDGEFVTFVSPTIFHRDGVRIDSTSTLRFRSREAIEESLETTGYVVDDVRDCPHRPGGEFVFVARKP